MFIWGCGEDSFTQFIEIRNIFYSIIKFTVELPRKEIDFSDVKVRLRDKKLETSLHIKRY